MENTPTKDMAAVNKYQQELAEKVARERNKWNASMAKNNAAILLQDPGKAYDPIEMAMTIEDLYQIYTKFDEQHKDEMPKEMGR